MDRFDRIFTQICDRLAFWSGGILVAIMALYVTGHVFARYVLKIGGLMGTYIFVGALLVPFIYLGLSYAWYKRGFIAIDIIQGRLKGKVLWRFQFVFLLLTLVLFVAILFGSFLDTVDSYIGRRFVGELAILTPEWLWKSTIVFGTLLMATRNVLDLIRMVRTGEVVPLVDR